MYNTTYNGLFSVIGVKKFQYAALKTTIAIRI